MKIHLDHAGFTSVSTTQAGNAEVWVCVADKKSEEGVWFYMTKERVERFHAELGEWLKEHPGPSRSTKG